MPKLGLKGKVAIGIIVVLAVMLIGGIFFSTSEPEVHLAANYGGSYGEPEIEHPGPFFELGPIWFTNTLITACITVGILAGFFYFATRKIQLIPRGLQNIAEAIIEVILDFIEGVAGKENARRFFPIIATIFLFVFVNAWMGLLPIFNIFGWGHSGTTDGLFFGDYSGFIVETAILRPANTDINVPLMLALVSFASVEYWGLTSIGFRHYMGKFFRFGQFFQGMGQLIRGRIKSPGGTLFYGAIDIFVGALELLSEFVRIISFTFRLFGNMTAGEVLLLMMVFLIPWLIALPFYLLEMLIGFIQALNFAGLTLVFATLAVTPHQADHN
jgi:F-type H+-transporting ATPase subunit a